MRKIIWQVRDFLLTRYFCLNCVFKNFMKGVQVWAVPCHLQRDNQLKNLSFIYWLVTTRHRRFKTSLTNNNSVEDCTISEANAESNREVPRSENLICSHFTPASTFGPGLPVFTWFPFLKLWRVNKAFFHECISITGNLQLSFIESCIWSWFRLLVSASNCAFDSTEQCFHMKKNFNKNICY